uniref:Uncharacterized protein n=1 Tax=Ralstonia solanacearum TaxID=305 RepID=A0A0S4U043_RALSL|nr:protein of unknown function [Ralstonia solanacearum]
MIGSAITWRGAYDPAGVFPPGWRTAGVATTEQATITSPATQRMEARGEVFRIDISSGGSRIWDGDIGGI